MDTSDKQVQVANTENTSTSEQSPLLNANSKEQNQKQTKHKKIRIALIMLAIVISLVIAKCVHDSFSGPFIFEYQNYLNNKYGKNEKFSYTGKHSENGCPMFNADFCEQLFTSGNSNEEFIVRYQDGKFTDQYYLVKYSKEFDDYYYEKYGKLFEDIIPYDYNISLDVIYPYFGSDKKQTFFKDVVRDVEKDELYNWSSPDIIINVDYSSIGLNEIEKINFSPIELRANNLVQEKKIILDRKDTIQFRILMTGSGRTGLCPSEFITIGPGSYNTNSPDKEIISCSKILYQGT